MWVLINILDIVVGFFILAVVLFLPVAILVYFIISLVTYINQKRKLEQDWVRRYNQLKKAKINLILSSSIVICLVLGVVVPHFWLVILFGLPVCGIIYFIASLMEYKRQKNNQKEIMRTEDEYDLKRAKMSSIMASVIMIFFVLMIFSLIYAFSQELFYM